MKNGPHLFAGRLVQSVAHQLHAEDKHRKAAEHIHQKGREIDPELFDQNAARGIASGNFHVDLIFPRRIPHDDGRRSLATGVRPGRNRAQ